MSYNKPLLLSVCQGGILRFHGHKQAFKGLLASDGGMLGILLGASPAMCLGVWLHDQQHTLKLMVRQGVWIICHTPKHIAGEAPNNIHRIPPSEAKSPLNACANIN